MNQLRKPEVKEDLEQVVKEVAVFSIGEKPTLTVQGKVEDSGITQIIAQAGGIVKQIKVNEGDRVQSGQVLVNIATNYQGGNVVSVQRQIAQLQVY